MEKFLLNFANTNTEVTSSNANLSVSPEFYGAMDISKGALTMKIHFWAKLYKMKYNNCISLDDWDINNKTDISFGDIPIDNLSSLKTMLNNSGLTTIANGLDINTNEEKKEICIQLEQSKIFKDIFGKKAKIFNNLSENEQKNIRLKFVIDNYENKSLINHDLSLFLVENEEGVKVNPSYEELVKMYTIN
jgi:hypothetical protein